MANRRRRLDPVGPFGNPDGSRADIEDVISEFVDFGGNPAYGHLATRANDSMVRVIVGKLGAGKTVYLRRLQDFQAHQDSVYADAPQQSLPKTEVVVKACQWFSDRVLVEKWMQIWERAILRSVASHLLRRPELRQQLRDEQADELEHAYARLLDDFRRPRTIYSQVRDIINERQTAHQLSTYLDDPLRDDLEDLLGEIIGQCKPIYFYEDYLLSYTRLIPRDIISLGNELSEEVLRQKQAGQEGLPPSALQGVVQRCAKRFGDSQLAQCANQISSDLMPQGAALHDYSELFTSTQAYISGVQEEVRSFVRLIGVDRFSRGDLEALQEVADSHFERATNLASVLWQNGLLGYVDEAGGRRFYSMGDVEQFHFPDVGTYVLHPCLVHAVGGIRHVRPDSAGAAAGRRTRRLTSPRADRTALPEPGQAELRSSAKAADYAVGDVLDGRFEILQIIGQGGFSRVYRVRDDLEGEERALKLFDSAAGYEAVRREIGALRKIQHPNVVKVFWADQTDAGDWYLITEFIDGESLDEFVTGNRRLRDREAVDVALDLLDALAAFHPDAVRLKQLETKRRDGELPDAESHEWLELTGKGLVHRDIKPRNVMLTRTGAKLLDFNIASRVGDPVHTQSGTPPISRPTPA
jgi:hypothetical protein